MNAKTELTENVAMTRKDKRAAARKAKCALHELRMSKLRELSKLKPRLSHREMARRIGCCPRWIDRLLAD